MNGLPTPLINGCIDNIVFFYSYMLDINEVMQNKQLSFYVPESSLPYLQKLYENNSIHNLRLENEYYNIYIKSMVFNISSQNYFEVKIKFVCPEIENKKNLQKSYMNYKNSLLKKEEFLNETN